MRGGDLFGDFGRTIRGAVVDHDDLALHPLGKRSVEDALQQRTDEFLFVIKGNQDRETRHFGRR